MKLSPILLATALIAAPAYAGTHVMNDEAAEYGHCTAYEASEQGREEGNASEAEPFQALEENASAANESVEEYCEDVDHPADEHRPEDPGAAEEHRPDDAGDEGDDRGEADEHRPDDAGREDQDRGQADERRGPP